MEFIDNLRPYSAAVLRISMSLLFLWFGINQLIFPQTFLGYLPSWAFSDQQGMGQTMHLAVTNLGGAYTLIFFNGFFEIVLGLLLLAGIFTRIVAFVLAVHLFGIAFTLGYNDIAVRDFTLSMATLVVAINGHDKLCFDKRK